MHDLFARRFRLRTDKEFVADLTAFILIEIFTARAWWRLARASFSATSVAVSADV
jgi:hypothetical protein